MKPDADDQQRKSEKQLVDFIKGTKPTPKWEHSASEIASDIADQFHPVASLQHADLRRKIIKAIEAEREVTKYYMTQMGRWWERFNSP